MVYNFKDDRGSHLIPNEDIVSITTDGIIAKSGSSGFRFYPASSVTVSEGVSDETDGIPSMKNKVDFNSFLAPSTGLTKEVYRYLFGIDSISLQRRSYNEVAGMISEPIHVDSASYIQLSVRHTECMRSLEFSILEGEKETPIVPIEYSLIRMEKIFPGLPLRFDCQTKKTPVIYKNGEAISLLFEDLDEADVAANDYYANYYPAGQSYLYYPEKDTDISIKVIQRCSPDEIPATISSMTIQKYGGIRLWNI